jgi:hypothetical protein
LNAFTWQAIRVGTLITSDYSVGLPGANLAIERKSR